MTEIWIWLETSGKLLIFDSIYESVFPNFVQWIYSYNMKSRLIVDTGCHVDGISETEWTLNKKIDMTIKDTDENKTVFQGKYTNIESKLIS